MKLVEEGDKKFPQFKQVNLWKIFVDLNAAIDVKKRLSGRVAPIVDADGDWHSPSQVWWRGANWRGKDCNDSDPSVKPGVYDDPAHPETDMNCNGIYGRDPSDGVSYEEKFCKDSDSVQILALGDSGTAGFSIHQEWLQFRNLTEFLPTALNEFDHPQLMPTMGHATTQSIYQMLRKRNLCNHRGYQNVAFNGASMRHFLSDQLPGLNLNRNHKRCLSKLNQFFRW